MQKTQQPRQRVFHFESALSSCPCLRQHRKEGPRAVFVTVAPLKVQN